jgi:hypothetical protein
MGTRWLAALVSCAIIGGCATSEPQAGAKGKEMTPEAAVEVCLKKVKWWPLSIKHEAATLMRVSLDKMPPLLCQRLIAAIASGRLTPQQIAKLRTAAGSDFYKIIKGL